MIIGSIVVHLGIEGAFSLKDRRRVLNSVKQKLKNRYNVAVSEIGDKSLWNRAWLGIVTCSDDRKHVESQLTDVTNFIDELREITIMDIEQEMY